MTLELQYILAIISGERFAQRKSRFNVNEFREIAPFELVLDRSGPHAYWLLIMVTAGVNSNRYHLYG